MAKSDLTAHQVMEEVALFNERHQKFNRSGDCIFPASDFPFYLSIGVEYVQA